MRHETKQKKRFGELAYRRVGVPKKLVRERALEEAELIEREASKSGRSTSLISELAACLGDLSSRF
jgi:hypothetical protein